MKSSIHVKCFLSPKMFYKYLLDYRNNLLSCTVTRFTKHIFYHLSCSFLYVSHASTSGENITKLESLNITEVAEFMSAHFTKWDQSVGLR